MNKINVYTLFPLLLSLSLPVAATKDGKVFHASKCQPLDYSTLPLFKYNEGKAENTYKTDKTLICPIENNISTEKKDGVYQVKVKVKVVDNSYKKGDPKIKCGINSRSHEGNYVDSSWGSSQPGATTKIQELTIPYSIDTGTKGYLLLVCSVPGYDDLSGERRYSSIVSYRLTEGD